MSLQTGQIIDDKYRIIRELGSGAMGAVYEGENVRIKRRVAIKVLLPSVAERGDVVERFEREAQAAGRIGSDHIVEVLDLGTLADGGFYMVMEFLEGETLGARIKRCGRLDPRELAPIVQQLLMGLEMAHDAQIIHRDLKPENVFLVREHAGQKDFAKILDFGVSKFNPLNDDDAMSMTRTGTVVGTPFYMAPEQAKGARDIDKRSDLYSVGVILYEAVTGQVPFHAGTFNELIFKIVLETPPPPEKFAPEMDPGFGRIVRKAMSREPGERYQTAAEFRDALYIWLHTGRDTAKPTELRAPPIGPDIDWDEEKKTLLLDGDDPSNLSTQIMAGGTGGGTALMAPEGGSTRLLDPTDGGETITRAGGPRGGPPGPPPPRKKASSAPPSLPAPRPQGVAHGVSAPPPPPPGVVVPVQAPVQRGPSGLGLGAPTPINRRPLPIEDWPTGVPRRRSATLPIVIGAVMTLSAGAAAAVFLLPAWTNPAVATEIPEETRGDDEEAPAGATSAAPRTAIAADATGEDDPPRSEDAASGDETAQNPSDEPVVAPPPPRPAGPEPAPEPRTYPAPRPSPVTPPPASPTPTPTPKPSPEPPPPPPRPSGRKVETSL